MARNDAFVGREQVLGELVARWLDAAAGHGGLVVVAGEPGIGKTRLVEQLAESTAGDRRVAWGACPGVGVPPLWPWRSILRHLGAGRVAPDDRGSASGTDVHDPAGDQARRYVHLADEVCRAASGPVLLVLDDLHWCDPDSVSVLRIVAAEARRLPLLVVATLRPSELPEGSALHGALTDLAASTTVVGLEGLPVDAVAALVSELTGRQATPDLARRLHSRTGGNPFFVRELLRVVVAEGNLEAVAAGADLPFPPRVRDVVLRRVMQLPAACRPLLDAAAVAGRDVDLAVLADVADTDADTDTDAAAVLAALAPAEAARLVEIVDGRVTFTHDLVRGALLDDLDGVARRGLHLALGRALQAAPGVPPAEIARHLCDALPSGDPVAAARAALTAGGRSLAVRAPADAARHLDRGIAAVGGDDPGLRLALLLALGEATARTGDRAESRAAYTEAAEIARATGDVDAFAAGVLGFAGMMGTPRTDPVQVDLLEEAAAALEGRRDALAARVAARLAQALLFSEQRARRSRLADEALAMARGAGDDRAVAAALYVWIIVHITSANFRERLERADELLRIGRASGDEDVEAWALHFHAHHMAEGGDFGAFDADVAACGVMAQRARNATWQWTVLMHRAMRKVMEGELDEGDRLGAEAFAVGSRSEDQVATATFGAHLLALRTWQGRLDELVPMMTSAAGQYSEVPGVWAAVPFVHAELGDIDRAAEELRRALASRALEDVPGAQSWTVALALLARAAQLVGDAAVARQVRALLEPVAGRQVVGPFAECYFGPASLYLGLCSAAAGDVEDAVAQLERAVAQADAVGARPVAAWARAELAEALVGRAGAEQRIAELRATASAELAALGMPRHLARLGDQPEPAEANIFRREGEAWSVTFAGRTVRLRATKGLADIHRLLDAAGTELHVLELAREADQSIGGAARQPVLDERAKSEYRRRLLELEEDIAEARAGADLARAELAESERDRIVAELVAALGLGGRDRSVVDEAERARQAVRARIRYTLDRIGRAHPDLRRHLDHALVTGTFCAYRPEHPTSWTTD